MGILDGLRNKVEALGEKAREGLEDVRDKAGDLLDDARDKAGDVVDDVRERLGQDDGQDGEQDGDHAPTAESEDIGPDSSSTDAVQPGYVTGEDADDSDEAGTEPDAGDATVGTDDDGATTTDTDAPDETEAEPAGPTTDSGTDLAGDVAEVDGGTDDSATTTGTGVSDVSHESEAAEPTGSRATAATDDARLDPVAKDVDPYEVPLSESIGSELSDAEREALAGVVGDDGTDEDA